MAFAVWFRAVPDVDGVLQAFANHRGNAAVFFFADPEPLFRTHVLELNDALADRDLGEVDLVIHSGGGSAHAAYQVMSLVRLHAESINACVPFWAKSAATLLCIGADKIVLGDHAELGPLDVQIYEEKKPGQGEFHSALDPFNALEQMQSFSVEALASAMRFIVRDYGMSYDESLRHAVEFVRVTTGSLVGRLDPEKLGQYSRELSVATEYAQRMLRRCSDWQEQKIEEVVEQLVYGYPSHEYIIDLPELKRLGFPVEPFPIEDREVVNDLRPLVVEGRAQIVKVVEPMADTVGKTSRANGEVSTAPIEAVPEETAQA